LGRITGDVKDFESALAASNARVVAFGASTAVLGGVIRSFKEIVNVTIEVEKNLAEINRVFGLSTAQLQKFSSALFEVSKATSSSFGEASKAALEFSRQGIKAEEVLQRTTDALLLAKLGGLSTANAIDALTASVNGFKNTGITTTQILNKLVAVEQNYAVGAGDLAEALSRTGQAAQEAGVNIDQLNALVTAAQEKTARGGAVIGNALKTIFTRLQRPETLDQLETFNIKVRDIEGNVLPAITILKNFSSVYGELADTQRAALSEQVAGVYQVNILKAIVGDLSSEQSAYNGALRDGTNATNEAQVAAAKLNQTLDALVSQTGTAAQQFANNIGQVTFEPLAKYTAQTFKSIFENLNDLLEGEGIGSVFANGFLKGIRNIIAGPGAIAAFYTLFKLIQNSFNFLTQALPQIAGITTESQKRKDIEASVLRILQQEGPLRQALLGYTGNQAAQAQLLLNAAKAQTAEYQQQLQIAQRLAPLLATKGVVVNPKSGQKGLAATRSSGYIPKITKMAETIGAQAGGYSPGQVVRSPVGGVMNTAEDVKYIPGFAQPFINPPARSKAGRAHRQRSIQQTGVDPYMAAKGFVPNFAAGIDLGARGKQFEKLINYYLTNSESYAGPALLDFPYPNNSITSASSQDKAKIALNDDTVFGDAKITSALYSRKDLIKKLVGSLNTSAYKKIINKANTTKSDYVNLNSYLPVKPSLISSKASVTPDQVNAKASAELGGDVVLNLARLFNNPVTDTLTSDGFHKRLLLNYIEDYVTIPNFSSSGFIPNFSPIIDDNYFDKHAFPGGTAIGPVPDKAIQNIIDRQKKRQMTYLDFDRTLVRTVGDIAYAKASPENKKGVLQKMFLNQEARLNDVKSSKLTQFGQLLRQKIQEKVIDPNLLGLMTASDETPGMPEYISRIWSIPKINQIYSAKPGTKEARLASMGISASGFIPNFAEMSMSQIAAAVRLGKMSEADARKMGWKPTSEKIAERKGRVAQEKSDKLAGISYKNIDVPWKTYDEFGGTNYDYGAAYEKHALSVLKAKYPTIQDAISAGIPGGPSSRVDALDKTTKTFFEFKGGDPTTPAELMAKFKGVRVQLVDKYRKELDTWNDVLVSNPNWGYSQGFIPNFSIGDKMRKSMLANNLRPILFDLANNKYGYSGQDGKEYLYHKDIYNNKLKTKGANINDFDFAELPNLVRGFIYPNGKIQWDYSDKQQEALKDSNIKAKVLAKLNTAKPELAIGKPKVLTDVQRLRMQLEAQGGASDYARGFIPNFADPTIKTNSGKDAIESFYRKGSEVEGKKLTGGVIAFPVPQTTDLYSVGSSSVNISGSGFGVPLYDAVLAEVSKKGAWLTSDRETVSDKARRIWDGYRKLRTGDVKNKKLPIKNWFLDPAFNNGSYEFPMNPQDLLKNKSTWPSENDPVWALQHAYQFKKSQLDSSVKNKMASGFIPNFAYKQAVMGLEERLSGNKAILDTSTGPFPFIRNSGQPNFAAAVADHGGLTQALTDSMTGQKAAGLMYDGYVPNFADFRSSGPIRQRSGRMVSNKQIDTAIDSYIKSIDLLTTNNFQINAAAQQILKNYNLQGAAFNNLLKQIKAHANAERSAAQAAQQTAQAAQQAAAQRQTQVSSRYQRRFGPESGTIFQRLGGAFGGFSGRQRAGNLEGRLGGLSNNIGFQLAAPIVGGVLEEAITQGKDRSQLSTTQRFAGNAASSVITGMSTGAALGTAFGGPGIGTAIGAVIGLGNAAIQAQDSVQDLANAADQYKAQTTATLDAGKSYIEQLNQLASISDPSLLNQATYKLSETFQELNKTSPELGKKFYEAGGDVEKMQTAMQEFAKNAALISNIKKLGASYKEAGDALSVIVPKRSEQLKRKGYNVENQSGEIKTTEGSLQTSFVQFQGFFDLLKEGGLSAENSAKFIEEFQKEMQGATDETTLKAIAQKYNISETVAAELAALSDNVIDEMGIEGDFFVKNSAVLVKKFYDETDKKFKTATQQAKEVQFNSRELLRKLRDGIDNYVFNIAKQIQQKEFEASRLNVLDNAASEFIDKLVTPLQAGARQAEAKIRQTSISQETERMRLSSDIAGASGKQIFETLGGGNKQVIEGLQKTVDNLQDPNLLEGTLKTLIQQTSSAQAAQQAGFKVGDPEKLATFNAQLKQQLQNTIMLSEKQKQQLEIQNLELELLNRRSEAAQVLLELEFQLINSELERNKVLNKSVTDNQIRTAKEKAIFERPGYGFGMSPTGIQSQKANQERAALQRSQAIEREKLFSGGEDFFKSRITKAVEDLKSARLIQSKNTNPIDEITGVANKENTKYNALQQAENKLQAFSTGQIKSVDDYKKRLEDLMGVLTPVSDTNKQIYDEVAKQLKAVNDLTEAQRSESKILNINLETQRLQALQVSLANKFYNERLETLLKTADAEQKAADALEVSLQALDTRQSRESNFYGLGVMGKAANQVDLNNQRLAIRQQQTTQQSLSGARGAVNEFATYQNEIANLKGPISLDRVKAKNAIANINTEIKNLDDAKAFADNLAKARTSLDSSSEDAKKLAGFENQVRGILQKNTSELEKQKAIQDLINKGVADEATDRTSMYQGFRSGFDNLITQGDEIGHKLGKEIPGMFADGMTNALMDVARGTKSIGDAFKDVAINFGQTLMQEVMRAAIGKALGTVGMGLFGGNQKGGLIHAQNGMYISGGRNGDRNLALLEDGEYVLNRNAVESFGGPGVLDKINYDMAPRFGSKMQGGGSFELVPEMQYNKDQEFDYTGNLMSGATNVGQIDQANYTAYAFAEDAYFKKMREKAVQNEQERVQKEFAKKQKNAQLISSIVGAVGSIALAGGMGMVAAKSAASAGAEGLKQAGAASVSSSASVATKEAFAKAQEAGGKTFAEFLKANPNDVLINGKLLANLNVANQMASGVNPLKISGGFGRFGGDAQLSNILTQQGFGPVKSGTSGLFGNIFTTGAGVVGSNVRRGRQTGGLIGFNSGGFVPYGSRLSDTIPALLTGGEYVMNNSAVKKYGLSTMNSMNSGSYQDGGSTATTNNSTNNNATNISINIDKSGKSVYGADSSSYEKQDIVLSKQMAKQINSVVLKTMSNEKRYGGELYKNPLRS
jgi:TP901 family phage tail tape measure protein